MRTRDIKVHYAAGTVSDDYRCCECGALGVKLWREYQTFAPSLFCVGCAEANSGRRLDTGGGASDQLGWLVPAIPDEEGVGFWGYTSVPLEGIKWWKALPMALPVKP